MGVTEQTYYRWRKEYGGLKADQAKKLKELEKENARLKRLRADAELDKAILKEAASGNYRARASGDARSITPKGGWESPSVGRAVCSGRTVRCSVIRRSRVTTRTH